MRVALRGAPWNRDAPGQTLQEAVTVLGDNVWRDAAVRYFAESSAKRADGRALPKGVQRYLNEVIAERLTSVGWSGSGGRYVKDKSWVRITFRHQMSLGSDIVDAIKAHKREGFTQLAILAASARFLTLISPNDATLLLSCEKVWSELQALDGCLSVPLFVGCLEAQSKLPLAVAAAIGSSRPRDRTVPTD